MTNEDRLRDLIATAVKLAIVRHGLTADGEKINEERREEIAIDTWHAIRGVDTCDGEEMPEFTAVKKDWP